MYYSSISFEMTSLERFTKPVDALTSDGLASTGIE